MENTVLTNIQFNLNMEELISKMRVKEGSPYEQRLKEVAGEALELGNLKAIYRGASIKEKGDDFVVIDETRFTSKILRNHLDQVENVFPFVVTCGNELKDWAESKKDILEMYWADVIKDMALEVAMVGLKKDIEERYGLGKIIELNPGALEDWHLEEQEPFFKLLQNVQDQIGVELSDSFIMKPRKSLSGIFFKI